MTEAYQKLLNYARETHALAAATGVLAWDQETFMPNKGGGLRSRSLAVLSRLEHQRMTDKRFEELIVKCENEFSKYKPAEKACVLALRRDRDQAAKIPENLAAALAETASLSQRAWAEARGNSNATSFLPWLTKMIALKREEAGHLSGGQKPYDALLDQYEIGATVATLAPVLDDLQKRTQEMLPAMLESQRDWNPTMPWGQMQFSQAKQEAFNHEILDCMGFDLEAGRLDASAHPFTQGFSAHDVRLTTRYRLDDIQNALYSTLHEGGHGLYEQGFLDEHEGTPLAAAVSLGIHESQSRLWENAIGRSLSFWRFCLPRMRAHFPDLPSTLTPEMLWKRANRIERSFIRVEADEVTYNLHIVLRFKLEQALFEGNLQVTELEGEWNTLYQSLLGQTPSTPSQGFLQDVHWSCGLFGYFPTYSLGNLIAAQLMDALHNHFPDLEKRIEQGNFLPIRDWLRDKIHRHGRALTPEALVIQATGKPLSAEPFMTYIKAKYLG